MFNWLHTLEVCQKCPCQDVEDTVRALLVDLYWIGSGREIRRIGWWPWSPFWKRRTGAQIQGASSKSPPFKRDKSTTLWQVDLASNGRRTVLFVLSPLEHMGLYNGQDLLLNTAIKRVKVKPHLHSGDCTVFPAAKWQHHRSNLLCKTSF